MATKKTVIVTGFEPFGEHAVNASWVAVQELECLGLGEGVELQVYELPVEYQAIQRLLPSLWKCHQPQLVVHVGVSGIATTVTLEQCGHNHGYCRLDNSRFCPASQCCVEAGPDCLTSDLDMELVCRRLGSSHQQVELSVSRDAGRYLCDYTYYTSLLQGGGRVAFVHVPPLGRPYSGGASWAGPCRPWWERCCWGGGMGNTSRTRTVRTRTVRTRTSRTKTSRTRTVRTRTVRTRTSRTRTVRTRTVRTRTVRTRTVRTRTSRTRTIKDTKTPSPPGLSQWNLTVCTTSSRCVYKHRVYKHFYLGDCVRSDPESLCPLSSSYHDQGDPV